MNILITGACGGMGHACVKLLSEKGHNIYALDRKISEKIDGVKYYEVDVTNMDSILNVYDLLKKDDITLDAIIHFAGIYYLDSLVEIEEEMIKKVFDINFFGIYRVNKVFLPLLHKNSKIIITSSELAPLDPLPFTGLYGISKSTVEKYAYSLRMELNLLNIKVAIIRPGAVKTSLLDVSMKSLDDFCNKTKLYKCNATNFKKVVDSVEAKNISAEKVARIALKILKSKRPRYIYNINRNFLLRILSFLPKRFQVFIIKTIIK
ncbi:MAG: SDR family NAD(P)-dependent oxidoreductase [Erysipelotrichaceae bacterium]|nr:SDR family NAD(P)-dependent oxidoreductase [Erysipelotrichaceae bacterium]